MPLSLAAAKELSQDKLTDIVIDEFRKSPLMDLLTFDNTVKPQGGRSLAYVYNRITTQPTAGGRALNGEYTAQETVTQQYTVNLKVMGGAYEIDRVIAEDETQVVNEVEFQSAQKAKATAASFNDQFINGDSADGVSFDGIDKIVTGSSTEITPATAIALDTANNISTNYKTFLYELRKMVGAMDGAPTAFSKQFLILFLTFRSLVMNSETKSDVMVLPFLSLLATNQAQPLQSSLMPLMERPLSMPFVSVLMVFMVFLQKETKSSALTLLT